jgi:two-component system sensor histidine kinase YesM
MNLRRWMPHRLKNRFILAFLVVILVPISLFQLFYYWQTEKMIGSNISKQNYGYLNVVKNDFESIKFEILRGLILIEKNQEVVTQLTSGWLSTPEVQNNILAHMKNSFQNFKFYNNDIKIYLIDSLGSTIQLGENVSYASDAVLSKEFSQVCTQPDQWIFKKTTHESLEFCSYLFNDNHESIGRVYFIMNVKGWLNAIVRNLALKQDYYIADANGNILAGTNSGTALNVSLMGGTERKWESYILDRSTSSVINSIYLPSINYYMISQFHLKSIIGDLNKIQRNLLISVGILTIVFIVITYLISSSIAKPLFVLQHMMHRVGKNNLKVNVEEKDYTGEILDLARSFNTMIRDINELVERLKREERQREAFHYQMLLSQLNPHFLINALNLVKWNAIDRKDVTTHEVCASLGILLEKSLNSEIDLIHLKNELELIRAYLSIQQLRYKDRFEVNYEIEERLLHALVPKFSLQPLIENAIIHGFAQVKGGGIIRISVRSEDNQLILEVADNGQGIQSGPARRSSIHKGGIGIANLKDRLKLMFKHETQFDIIGLDPGTMIRLRFPLHISEPYNQEVE